MRDGLNAANYWTGGIAGLDSRGAHLDIEVSLSLSPQQRISLDLNDVPVMVTADRTELMQIMLNLALNARDALGDAPDQRIGLAIGLLAAAPPGLALSLGTAPEGPVAHISVSDNGCGIATTDLANIFRPFYTRKDGSGTGTGLGLAVVAGIVPEAGAGLAVSSGPGEGTRFDIFWPLEPPSGKVRGQTARSSGALAALGAMTVLLVDDEPAVLETLTEMLECAGAEVGPCVTPGEALTALREDPEAWSLLVTDYDMSDMDGAALAEAARAIRPDLPVLLITALPDAPRVIRHEGTLFDAVSGKLVSVDGLIAAARAAIVGRRATEPHRAPDFAA